MATYHKKIKILLGDDHTLFRNGLSKLLNEDSDLCLIGEAENGKELVSKYFVLKPDLVLTDISMPLMSGIDAIAEIKKKDEEVRALVLSIHSGEEYIYYTYKAGGMGLVSKSITQGELYYAIRKVYYGENYFGPDIDEERLHDIIKKYENIAPQFNRKNEFLLTDREKEVLLLIGEALTSNEIAKKLNVSRRTIDTHRANLIQKLRLKSMPELITYAVRYSVGLFKNDNDSQL